MAAAEPLSAWSVRSARRLVLPTSHLISDTLFMYGVLGLLITGFDFYSNVTGVTFLGMTVNPLTNTVHLVAGLVGIAMGASPRGARRYLLLIGALGVPLAVAGFLLDGTMSDYFATNTPMNVAHLVIGVVALAVGLGARGELTAERQLAISRRYLPEVQIAPTVGDPPREPEAGRT
jgi:hypothetical protein